MTPREINIIISKHCGTYSLTQPFLCSQARVEFVEDYATNLNAMHKAEQHLTRDQTTVYMAYLDAEAMCDPSPSWRCIHSAASSRARAFVKTIQHENSPQSPTCHLQ